MRRNLLLIISFFAVATAYVVFTPAEIEASGGCLPLYNGGITTQEFCPTPTPIPYSPDSPFPAVNPQTGQPVYPSSKSSTTPNTGPGDWTLISLVGAGITGWYIRKKTNISSPTNS